MIGSVGRCHIVRGAGSSPYVGQDRGLSFRTGGRHGRTCPCRFSLKGLDETGPPAGVNRLPPQYALRLGVGATTNLRHHRHAAFVDHEPGQPGREAPGWLCTHSVRQEGKPLRHRRGVERPRTVICSLPYLPEGLRSSSPETPPGRFFALPVMPLPQHIPQLRFRYRSAFFGVKAFLVGLVQAV